MRIHKTKSSERGIYKYFYADGTKFTVTPGENGVTEIDIQQLHRIDDSEVYNNIKNAKPPVEAWQKSSIEEWKKLHPDEEPPKNWAISLQQLTDPDNGNDLGDKSSLLKEISDLTNEQESPVIDRLHDLIESLSPQQHDTYRKVIIEGIPMVKVAAEEGVSETAIRHRMDKIKARIANDEILQKFFQ